MTQKHTALPEIGLIEKYTDNGEYSHCDILDLKTGNCIAQVASGTDAEKIVKACNSYYEDQKKIAVLHSLLNKKNDLQDKLVAALKEAAWHIHKEIEHSDYDMPETAFMLGRLNAAIAKARCSDESVAVIETGE